jgi:hypothetical protein
MTQTLNTGAGAPGAPNGPSAISNRMWIVAGALTLLGLVLPIYAIWSQTYVPLNDLSNHMARHYLEYRWLSGRGLPPFYEINYRIMPNLGGDLVAPLFFFLFAPMTAVKAFLTGCVLLYWIGPSLFIWQQGGRTCGALVAAMFWLPWLLSTDFFWGLTTNYSGMGLAFVVLAHHGLLRNDLPPRRPAYLLGQMILHSALVTLLFFWHLAAWGVYCLIVGCGCISRGVDDYRQRRTIGSCLGRAVAEVLPIAPSVLLLGWYALSHVGVGEPVIFQWGSWSEKARFVDALFGDYDAKTSALVLFIWAVAMLSTFSSRSLFWKCFRFEWLHLAIVMLVIAYLVLPHNLLSVGADSRLLPAILVTVLSALGKLPVRRVAFAVVVLAACVVLRGGAVVRAWNGISVRLDSYAQAFALIEPGSRVMPVTPTWVDYNYPDMAFYAWAAVSRDAFIPTLFSRQDSHVLHLTAQNTIFVKREVDRYEFEEGPVSDSYDYVWLYNPEQKAVRVPEGWRRVFSADPMSLWRVAAPAGETGGRRK